MDKKKNQFTEDYEKKFNDAIILKQKGCLDDAKQIFESLINDYADISIAYVFLADLYSELENYAKAVDLLRKAVKLKPESEKISVNLFFALMDAEQSDEAFTEVKRFDREYGLGEQYKEILKEINECDEV